MNYFKKYYNKLLNYIFPNRRTKILSKMMKDDEKSGLYD